MTNSPVRSGRHTSPVSAVVLDIGGVLEIKPPHGVYAKWEGILKLAPGELDRRAQEVWQAGEIGAIDEMEVRRRLSLLLEVDRAVIDALLADTWEAYLGTLNVELTEYLRSLRSRLRTGLLSNSFVGAREREQRRYGFGDLVDDIVYSHEVGRLKPDPAIYRLSAQRLGVAADQVLYLDDNQRMVDGARAVGMRAIRFSSNTQAIRDMESHLAS